MRYKKTFAFGVVCLGLILSTASSLWSEPVPSHWFHISQLGARAQLSDQPTTAIPPSKRQSARENPLVMIDAVLSIIQNYYVDSQRVKLDRLQELAVTYVKTEENVTVVQKDNLVLFQKGRKSFSLKSSEAITYRELVANLAGLVRFLESADDVLPDEKRQSKEIQMAAKLAPVLERETKTDEKSVHTPAFRVLNGILAQLDPHSNILDTDAYNELMQGTEGVFGGLGVVVGIRGQVLTVIKPIPNSPASRAGVKKGDRILKIGQVETFGFSLDELVEHMRGAPGTSVTLQILKDGSTAPQDVLLTREVIQVQTVESKIINTPKGEYLHVSIDSFASRTSTELAAAIKQAIKTSKTHLAGVIMDLRSNPGGLLDQAIEVADLFLQEGVIVSTKGRREEVEKATSGFNEFTMPLIVLMNSESASASEIVAGALQDNKRALVIGQPSFGKGSVQTIFKLPREQALKLTIARHYTPNGGSIQNVGIMPQIWLQPIIQGETNENLLGDYRYRSERYLSAHLEMNSEELAVQDSFVRNVQYKAFYLTKPSDAMVEDKVDHEMKLAVKVLDEVSRVYGDKPPEGKFRADHILALAAKTVTRDMEESETQVDQFTSKNLKVNWAHDGVRFDIQKPLLTLEVPETVELENGVAAPIVIKLKNVGPKPVERLSLFLKPKQPTAGTFEQLVGALAPGQEWKGAVPLTLLRGVKEDKFDVDVGVAADAMPIAGIAKKFTVISNQKLAPNLEISTTYIDAPHDSHIGFIEPREDGQLRVVILNKGVRPLTHIKVQMYNLSGTQVACDDKIQNVPQLAPGQKTEVDFKVHAADKLPSAMLTFGFSVQSAELVEKRRIRLSVPTVPNQIQVAKEIKP